METAGKPPGLLVARGAELRQAVRVMVGAAVAFLAYKLLGLEQGYWAVITVVIVLQGSIGGTLGAAADRMAGTVAGALLGGIAAILFPQTLAGILAGLALVTAITAYAAAIRPQLRIAPVTAAIVLLTQRPDMSTEAFVLDRVAEIALGGFIGVAVSLLVLPARSRAIVVARAGEVLALCRTLMRGAADALDGLADPPGMPQQAPLRKSLAAVEAAMVDAERERNSRLAEHGIPAAVPRTLWRIRNDIVQINRGLEIPLPPSVGPLRAPAAALLRAEAAFAERCGTAFAGGVPVDRGDLTPERDALAAAVAELRREQVTRALDFDEVGRVFGFVFALDQLQRDLGDLANRIDEAAAAPARRSLLALFRR